MKMKENSKKWPQTFKTPIIPGFKALGRNAHSRRLRLGWLSHLRRSGNRCRCLWKRPSRLILAGLHHLSTSFPPPPQAGPPAKWKVCQFKSLSSISGLSSWTYGSCTPVRLRPYRDYGSYPKDPKNALKSHFGDLFCPFFVVYIWCRPNNYCSRNLGNSRFTNRTPTNLGRSHRLPHVCTNMIHGKFM
jgi:hypothetical protein